MSEPSSHSHGPQLSPDRLADALVASGDPPAGAPQMTDADYAELKAQTVAACERGARGELTKAERAQTTEDIGRVLAEARRRIADLHRRVDQRFGRRS
jgi:hypothetical protein